MRQRTAQQGARDWGRHGSCVVDQIKGNSPMDLEHQHPTPVHAIRACTAPDARDLLAVAGEHTVEVLQVSDTALRRVASFHVGARITALAWSPHTVSPASSDAWAIECVLRAHPTPPLTY